MILEKHIPVISDLLRNAALAGTTVSYGELYDVFEEGQSRLDVFDTLEAAGRSLADLQDAIYTSLLAKRATGLPGDGFFDTFLNLRSSEWEAIVGKGKDIIPDIPAADRRRVTDVERKRVYAHASAKFRK